VVELPRDPSTGKRRQQWHTIKGTKRDAEQELANMLHSLEAGSYVKPNRITVGEYLKQWSENYAVLHTSPRTCEGYNAIVHNHVIPALGAIPLRELRPQHLEDYYTHKLIGGRKDGKGGLSSRTVLHHHRVLSEALKHAVKTGLLSRNVAELVTPPRATRPNITTLASEDIPRFLEAASKSPHYVLFVTALSTGMRLAEILGLRWCDVDFDLDSIYVSQTLYKRRGICQMREPKSGHSRRKITMPLSLKRLLGQHKALQQAQRIILGKPLNESDLVFAYPDGRPLDAGVVSHGFGKMLTKAGLPHIRFHDLRHTHATLLLKRDIHPKIVSERLGHANIAITLDTYSHVMPGLQEKAAKCFDDILESKLVTDDVCKMFAKN
jgi:integrase